MNIKSKSWKTSLKFFYVSLAIFLLFLLVVYSSSNKTSEFFPSMRAIAYFFFLWIILPICFLLSVIGCSLAAEAISRIQYKHFIIGFSLNVCMILAYCGYLWAYHSDFIYHTFEMNPRARMQYAVDHNKLWMVKWELMKGADVNREYWYHETLLMYAVRNHKKELLDIVLNYHPGVNTYCDIQNISLTPLHCVAGAERNFSSNTLGGIVFGGGGKKNLSSEIITKRTHRRMVLRRFKNQTSEERRRGAGIIALSSQKEQIEPSANKDWDPLEAAELLLEHGADPDLRLKSSDRKRSYKDITAVSLAYDNGKSDIVDLLLSHGADVNIKTTYQEQTLLHAAVEQGDVEIVKRLIVLGAKLDVKDNDMLNGPKSPLQMAVAFEDIECTKALIENGANVNIMFSEGIGGNTPLHLAVMAGNMDMIQLLLNNDADVNAKTINGKTPLHLAVDFSKGETEIVKLLLGNGADPNVSADFSNIRRSETENHTPVSLARKRKYSAIADLLLSYDTEN